MKLKYLRVLFTSDGNMEREMDQQVGAASAVPRTLYQTVGPGKRQRSRKAKLSIFQVIYVPTLTNGHGFW